MKTQTMKKNMHTKNEKLISRQNAADARTISN